MLHKMKDKENGFLDSEEYKSLTKVEKYILHEIFKSDVSVFLDFIKLMKGKSKKRLRKFLGRQIANEEFGDISPDDLRLKILCL